MTVLGLLILASGIALLWCAWTAATVDGDFFGFMFFGLLGVPTTFIGLMVTLAAFASL